MGYDWRIAAQVLVTVLVQLIMAYLVRDLPWKFVWLLTYIVSGTLNHSLSISFHESTKEHGDLDERVLSTLLLSSRP